MGDVIVVTSVLYILSVVFIASHSSKFLLHKSSALIQSQCVFLFSLLQTRGVTPGSQWVSDQRPRLFSLSHTSLCCELSERFTLLFSHWYLQKTPSLGIPLLACLCRELASEPSSLRHVCHSVKDCMDLIMRNISAAITVRQTLNCLNKHIC